VAKALALLEKGSTAKDGEATYNLAQAYASGISERQQDGTPKEVLKADEAKALEYLKKAVEREHAPAMNDYGARMFQGDKDGKGKDPQGRHRPVRGGRRRGQRRRASLAGLHL